jgi:RNA polymerase II subunit A small phosphatase-like protein
LKPTQERGRKKTLILDLDETLIHTFFEKRTDSDIQLDIEIEGEVYRIYIFLRPGVVSFLSRMSKIYEVIIFTASMSTYAEPIIEYLEKKS